MQESPFSPYVCAMCVTRFLRSLSREQSINLDFDRFVSHVMYNVYVYVHTHAFPQLACRLSAFFQPAGRMDVLSYQVDIARGVEPKKRHVCYCCVHAREYLLVGTSEKV